MTGAIRSRRSFLKLGLAAAAAGVSTSCGSGSTQPQNDARLRARPSEPTGSIESGDHPLELGGDRDGFLHVPPGYRPDTPGPLAILLHGAGGRAEDMTGFLPVADELDMLVLAPESRGRTWDLLEGGFGADVGFLDDAVSLSFARCAVDASRLALGGFSDGASYALSLGLTNGDLFSHLIAFSPGLVAPRERHGRPRAFVSHGTSDPILSVEATRREIVPQLIEWGIAVRYEEFNGGHTVPVAVGRSALEWLTA